MGSDMALFIVDHKTSKLLFGGGGQGGTKKHLRHGRSLLIVSGSAHPQKLARA